MTKLPFNRNRIGRVLINPDPNAASPTDGRNTGINPNLDTVNPESDNTTDYAPQSESNVMPIIIGAIVIGFIVFAVTD